MAEKQFAATHRARFRDATNVRVLHEAASVETILLEVIDEAFENDC